MAAAAGVLGHRVSYVFIFPHELLSEVARGGFRVNIRDGVGTTGGGLLAALAVPDADGLALDGVLSAEGAGVLGVLRGFHLLDHLPQRGTVSVIPEISPVFFVNVLQSA